VSRGVWRSDTVSSCVSWNNSWRTAYLRSSRTLGSAKSSRVERLAPRSRPTTLSPALVSSRARMLPVNPTPMQTASTSLSMIAITRSRLGKVRDRARRLVVFLAEIFGDLLPIGRREAGVANHLPARHVAVAAIDRVGEKALHGDLQKGVEEHPAGEALERRLVVLHGFQDRFAVLLGQTIEILAAGLAGPGIGLLDAGAEEL